MNGSTKYLIPRRVSIDGDWLTWDPWPDDALREAPAGPERDLDAFATIARPATDRDWRTLVLGWAHSGGPLSWCSACWRQHRLEWRMEPPPKLRGGSLPHGMREPLADWQAAAEHVNALRRLMERLRAGGSGLPDDWSTIWPDRPGGLAQGPDPEVERDLIAIDRVEGRTIEAIERPLVDLADIGSWADIGWQRRRVAEHLTAWLDACHVGRVVRWGDEGASVGASSRSWLGELGELLVRSLEDGTRIRSCTGRVRERPCRITWTVVHDKPRPKAPILCDACYALYRQRQQKGEQP